MTELWQLCSVDDSHVIEYKVVMFFGNNFICVFGQYIYIHQCSLEQILLFLSYWLMSRY